uniref:Uncharacterized protein n=1 Tax=Kuenenia stuttgartiensis TaxID=174633 RepID=Q1Q5E2_KUEST|nr:unknown protein [Candidatus Kuenenia stuttgartiensis]
MPIPVSLTSIRMDDYHSLEIITSTVPYSGVYLSALEGRLYINLFALPDTGKTNIKQGIMNVEGQENFVIRNSLFCCTIFSFHPTKTTGYKKSGMLPKTLDFPVLCLEAGARHERTL